ncbi:MAG: YfbM family protein [Myxococcota bacterium]|nr:YfbM family protein [Myxococcota bacterium]
MSGRGVLFAIDDDDLARLGDARDDAEVQAIVDDIEERWETGATCELDKSWDAIHRALTGGDLAFDNGTPPLSLAILGGHRLLEGAERIVTVKAPDEVHAIAGALRSWDRARLREAYYRIPKQDYGDLDEEDLDYVWAFFQKMVELYRDAARAERGVVFSV